MKKIRLILSIVIFVFLIDVKALNGCSSDKLVYLKELASNVEFKTSYEIKDDSKDVLIKFAEYKINIVNMNDDLKILYREKSQENYKLINDIDEFRTIPLMGGSIYNFQIYSYTADNCTNELLKTVKVELPEYNLYYANNKEKCSKYPEFKYCQEVLNVKSTDFEKIDKLFNEYIIENTKTTTKNIQDNLLIYEIIGLIFIMIIVVVIVIIVIKKRKKKMNI